MSDSSSFEKFWARLAPDDDPARFGPVLAKDLARLVAVIAFHRALAGRNATTEKPD